MATPGDRIPSIASYPADRNIAAMEHRVIGGLDAGADMVDAVAQELWNRTNGRILAADATYIIARNRIAHDLTVGLATADLLLQRALNNVANRLAGNVSQIAQLAAVATNPASIPPQFPNQPDKWLYPCDCVHGIIPHNSGPFTYSYSTAPNRVGIGNGAHSWYFPPGTTQVNFKVLSGLINWQHARGDCDRLIGFISGTGDFVIKMGDQPDALDVNCKGICLTIGSWGDHPGGTYSIQSFSDTRYCSNATPSPPPPPYQPPVVDPRWPPSPPPPPPLPPHDPDKCCPTVACNCPKCDTIVKIDINQQLLNTISQIVSQQQQQVQAQSQTQQQTNVFAPMILQNLQLQLTQLQEQYQTLQNMITQTGPVINVSGFGNGGTGPSVSGLTLPIHVNSDGTWTRDFPIDTPGPWDATEQFIPEIISEWDTEDLIEKEDEKPDTTDGPFIDEINSRERGE